jgi:hypothetical protein
MAHPLDEPRPLNARLPAPDGAQEVLLPATLDVKLVCSGCEPPLAAAHGAVAPFLLLFDHGPAGASAPGTSTPAPPRPPPRSTPPAG